MPTVSFYLKNEDYDKWRALEKPGEFIHNALNQSLGWRNDTTKDKGVSSSGKMSASKPEDVGSTPSTPAIDLGTFDKADEVVKAVEKLFKPCKHGADPRFCKHGKPGKPCK